ncbi:MAG: sugar MFS transporter [Bacteroidales bacterium]|jgi:glucose/galactose transporter|nr:sugar MFS transporter [Bacteroidales bacterium]
MKPNTLIAIILVGTMFFIFGFVSWVNSILIPYFKIACELTSFQAYFVAFAFYISYLVLSLPASVVLKKVGYKRGIMYGFICMAIGAAVFVPAALTRTYAFFLSGLFLLGAGLTILQSAANPYITIIGPIESAARRISIMGVCNKLAGILSPLIFAAVILKASDKEMFGMIAEGALDGAAKEAALAELLHRVIGPYSVLAAFLLLFGIYIRFSPLPEINPEEENRETPGETSRKSVFGFPYLILGAIAMFLHVGTQVVSVDTVIGYASSMGIDLLDAKVFPSYVLTMTITGYLLGILLIPKYVSQTNALRFCTVTGFVLSLCVVLVNREVTLLGHTANLSIWFLVALGFANSLVYAGIWPLSIRGLGRFTKTGSSLLIMGLCGNAIMPVLYGYLADRWDVRQAYWLLAPCYMYLIFFAIYGHKIESWNKRKKTV